MGDCVPCSTVVVCTFCIVAFWVGMLGWMFADITETIETTFLSEGSLNCDREEVGGLSTISYDFCYFTLY